MSRSTAGRAGDPSASYSFNVMHELCAASFPDTDSEDILSVAHFDPATREALAACLPAAAQPGEGGELEGEAAGEEVAERRADFARLRAVRPLCPSLWDTPFTTGLLL
jgi:hypothetical protein